jgi:hypothetical protein
MPQWARCPNEPERKALPILGAALTRYEYSQRHTDPFSPAIREQHPARKAQLPGRAREQQSDAPPRYRNSLERSIERPLPFHGGFRRADDPA